MLRQFLLLLTLALSSHSFIIPSKPLFASHLSSSLNARVSRGLSKKLTKSRPSLDDEFTIYVKAARDGTVGDCPFAHYLRSVMTAKGIEYTLRPSIDETKPSWLVKYYDGKMPALRHGSEAYIDSTVISDYITFFFPEEGLSLETGDFAEQAAEATSSFFPSFAGYIKKVEGDEEQLSTFKESLAKIESHLATTGTSYLTSDELSTADLQLAPQLYHMKVSLDEFKSGSFPSSALFEEFPALQTYFNTITTERAFLATKEYGDDAIVWGWTNARNNSS